jgi:hypothetical protein
MGTAVEVSAIPQAGYRFVEWQEGGVFLSTDNPMSISMTQDRSPMAIFEEIVVPPEEYALTISVIGSGTTSPLPGAYTVLKGQTMTVTATPSSGYQLDHWEGDVSGTIPFATFQVNGNMSIVAVFIKEEPPAFIELLWDFLPFFPWEGPPLPRFTAWDWEHLPFL